ncbi:PREDICTED: uncharacterized protein LOC102016421 [Chinchilla lanigera]|uniref:uncharacterized protein LOC102016421 n=1 Tax=Chinchilla lanigera TaxID=34839 RepID=UPI000697C90F|nr:PREDICTED: uncharacterized protein LOC102016421 [Chinchilla lanigera]
MGRVPPAPPAQGKPENGAGWRREVGRQDRRRARRAGALLSPPGSPPEACTCRGSQRPAQSCTGQEVRDCQALSCPLPPPRGWAGQGQPGTEAVEAARGRETWSPPCLWPGTRGPLLLEHWLPTLVLIVARHIQHWFTHHVTSPVSGARRPFALHVTLQPAAPSAPRAGPPCQTGTLSPLDSAPPRPPRGQQPPTLDVYSCDLQQGEGHRTCPLLAGSTHTAGCVTASLPLGLDCVLLRAQTRASRPSPRSRSLTLFGHYERFCCEQRSGWLPKDTSSKTRNLTLGGETPLGRGKEETFHRVSLTCLYTIRVNLLFNGTQS